MTPTLVFPAVALLACGLAGCRAQGSGQRDLQNAVTRLEQQMRDVDRYLSQLERGAEAVSDAPKAATTAANDELGELRELLKSQDKALAQRIRALEQNQQKMERARQSLEAEHARVLKLKEGELAAARAELDALRAKQRDSRAEEPASDASQRSRQVEKPRGDDANRNIARPSTQEHEPTAEAAATDDAETIRRLRAENAALKERLRSTRPRRADSTASPTEQAQRHRPSSAGGASDVYVHGAGRTLIIHADQGTVNVYVDDAGKASVRGPRSSAAGKPSNAATGSTAGGRER